LIDDLLADARARMTKSVEATRHEFATVRTGRASPHLLDRVEVDYYGTRTPLRQLSNIAVPEGRLLTVTPFDKSSIKSIEKAIMESDLGLTPNSDGQIIRRDPDSVTSSAKSSPRPSCATTQLARSCASTSSTAIRSGANMRSPG